MDHRQTHDEPYRVVAESGNVVTFARESDQEPEHKVEGRLELVDDDTMLWSHPTLGNVVMKRAHARGRP